MENKLSHTTNYGKTDTFTIVDDFPVNYFVWAIGRANFPFEGYIPLAKAGALPYHIDPDTLLALKVRDEETALKILRHASRHGVDFKKFQELTK